MLHGHGANSQGRIDRMRPLPPIFKTRIQQFGSVMPTRHPRAGAGRLYLAVNRDNYVDNRDAYRATIWLR
jgi:hypothetical protein